MIRECTYDDIPWMMEHMQVWNTRYEGDPLNLDKLEVYLETIIDVGVTLRHDHGYIIGHVADDPVRDVVMLVKLSWVADKNGMQLLKAFEAKGKELGVDRVLVSAPEAAPVVGNILRRRGYAPVEMAHSIKIGD